MITEKTREFVWNRAGMKCENPKCRKPLTFDEYEFHHCEFRSQYRGIDRDEEWNGACLCSYCHRGDGEKFIRYVGEEEGKKGHMWIKWLDVLLKACAEKRKHKSLRAGGIHPDLIKKRKASRSVYKKNMDNFKKENGGLSPSQIQYRKQKQWIKDNKNI